jgi:hypothetical protein
MIHCIIYNGRRIYFSSFNYLLTEFTSVFMVIGNDRFEFEVNSKDRILELIKQNKPSTLNLNDLKYPITPGIN